MCLLPKMKMVHVVFVGLVHLVLLDESTGKFVGCYKENRAKRHFAISAGNYNPKKLTPATCSSACSKLKYKLAGLTAGFLCFCSNEKPSSSPETDACQQPCQGDSNLKCGDLSHVSVYETSPPVRGVRLHVAQNIVEVFKAITIDVDVAHGPGDLTYAIDCGDQTEKTDPNGISTFKKNFSMPGEVRPTVFVGNSDNSGQSAKATVPLLVEAPVKNLSISCPEYVPTHEEFMCEATVLSGTHMSISILFKEKEKRQNFTIADATWHAAGNPIGEGKVSQVGGTYVWPYAQFLQSGRLIAWETHAIKPGKLSLMILRPYCDNTEFCFSSNTCGRCGGQATKCSTGELFCVGKGLCYDNKTEKRECKPQNRDVYSWRKYKIKKLMDYYIPIVGQHVLDVDERVDIEAGDVIGLSQVDAEISTRSYTGADQYMLQTRILGPHEPGSTLTFTSEKWEPCNFRAIVTTPSKVRFYHTYSETGEHDLAATVVNRFIDSKDAQTVKVKAVQGIDKVVIESDKYVATNTTHKLTLLPHNAGEDVAYLWIFGDGQQETSSKPTCTHTYKKSGQYNITVNVTNSITSKSNESMITVQDRVIGLNVKHANYFIVGNITVRLFMESGSQVTCTWDLDGVIQKTLQQEASQNGELITFILTDPKVYQVKVTCSNQVSEDSKEFTLIVQHPITGLDLWKYGARVQTDFTVEFKMVSGTNATVRVTFEDEERKVNFDPVHLNGSTEVIPGLDKGMYSVSLEAVNLVSNASTYVNFSIEHAIVNPICNFNETVIKIGETVEFVVGVESGSGVQITIKFEELSPPRHIRWSGTLVREQHTFNNPGMHNVTIKIFNTLNLFVCHRVIKVIAKVEHVTLNSNSPVEYDKAGALVIFSFTFMRHAPTDAFVEFDFGDGTEEGPLNFTQGQKYPHRYMTYGSFRVICVMKNEVGHTEIGHIVRVVIPVTNMKLHVTPPYAAVHQLVQVGVSMDQGADVTFRWFSGDNNARSPEAKRRTGTDPMHKDFFNHTYDTAGSYEITVVAENALSNTTVKYKLLVQHPVMDSDFSITSNAPLVLPNGNLFVTLAFSGKQRPSLPKVFVDWADGRPPTVSSISFDTGNRWTLKRDYSRTEGGSYKANVTIHNDASAVTYIIDAGVYRPITAMNMDVMYQPLIPVGAKPQPGFGERQNEFPFTRTLLIMPKVKGTVQTYDLEAKNTKAVHFCEYNETTPLVVKLPQAGHYDLKVTARNPDSSLSSEMSVILWEGITGINIDDGHNVTAPGHKKVFNLSFTSLGYEACLLVHWGDDSSSYFGNQTKCAKSNVTNGGSLHKTMNVSHAYHKQKQYVLTAFGWDYMGNTTANFTFSVSASECSSPIIDIKDAARSFYRPKDVYRMDRFVVYGLTNLKCSTTLVNEKRWQIFSIKSTTGQVENEIQIDSVPSRYNAELAVEERFLAVGLYKFVYKIQMTRNEFPGRDLFSAEAFTYISVKSSPLVPVIIEGGISRMTVGHGQDIVLSPDKYSLDPDLESTQPQLIEQFLWFCHRIDEKLPVDDKGRYDNLNATSPLKKSEIDALEEDRGGCFRQGPGPVYVPDNGGSLTFNTVNMLENERYKFHVEARKGGRSAKATLQMDIVRGEPPHVSIRCAYGSICRQRNDGQGINPSNRLAVMAVCLTGCSDDIKYSWSLAFMGFTEDHWIEIQDIENHVEGLNSPQITFTKSILQSHNWYRIKLKAERQHFPAGFAFMNLAVNQPPEGGTCTVNRTVGVAFTDVWHLKCSGWFDMDGITMYQFYAVFKGEPMECHLSYDVENEIVTVLPPGPAYDNFTMTLKVRIADESKSVIEVTIGVVQVVPPPSDDLAQNFKLIVDSRGKQTVAAQGDTLETNREYLRLASALNLARETSRQVNVDSYTVASTRSTGYGPRYKYRPKFQEMEISNLTADEQEIKVQADRDKRAELREEMSLALANLTKPTVESIQLSASTISVLSEAPEELTRKSQGSLSESLKNMSQTLYELSDDTPREEVIRTSANLISASGGIFQASMVTLNHGTRIDIERATKGPHYEYDTSLEAKTLRLDGYDKATATKMFKKETNKLEQKDAAPGIVSNLMDTLNLTTAAIMKSSIPGESKVQLVTPKLSYTVQMDTASKILNTTLREGEAEAKLPGICQLVNHTNCSDDQVVTLRSMATPNNMYRHVPNGDNAPEISGTVSLDMYDENRKEMPIQDAPVPLRLQIPRDPRIDVTDATNVTAVVAHSRLVDLFFRSFYIKSHSASVHIEVIPDDPDVKLLVLGRFGGKFPNLNSSEKSWDFMNLVPSDSPPEADVCGTPDRHVIFLDNNFVNNRTGKVVLGFREITTTEHEDYQRGVTPGNLGLYPRNLNNTFQLRTYTSGCYFYDNDGQRLSPEGCRVCADTTHTTTVCECNHMTTFAGGWAVQPNSIDWEFVFSNMDFTKNPTLYVTMINITVLFVGFAVWARYQDKQDLEKLGVTPLEDNDPEDKYLYEVIFVTGSRRNAGTDSRVQFILSGESDETDVRLVRDKKRKILRRGSTNSFLMATSRPLGALNYCRVWHDNSGKGKFASWYLKYIIIRDLQTRDRHYFICNRWFAVEEDDGQVDRTIPVAGPEQMRAFAQLFGQRTRKNLGDEHLWFSVIARPPTSRFTRLQRVSCCLCLLYTSMFANALYYNKVPDVAAPGQQAYTFGPFALSMEQIFVGIATNLVVFPVNFVIVLLFRKARPRHKRPSRIQEALKKHGAGPGGTLTGIKPDSDKSVAEKSKTVTGESSVKTEAKPIASMSTSKEGNIAMDTADGVKKEKKKRFEISLPWYFSVVAWILLSVTVLVSASFVLFYGISFGNNQCRKWISSMVMSFVTSIFLTQPLKVILMAFLFSLIFKKQRVEEELDLKDEDEHELSPDEEFLHWEHHTRFAAAARPRRVAYRPPGPEQLEKAREHRLKELKMYDILREVLFYAMFLWILLVISYSYRDPNAYLLKKGMEDLFINNDAPCVDGFDNDFTKVDTIDRFWNWTEFVLVPGLRAGKWYNGEPPLEQRGFVGDRVGRIMGYATIRQLRVKPDLCEVPVPMLKSVNGCNVPYTFWDEEERDYGVGWLTRDMHNKSVFEYTYRTGHEIDSYPYWGLHGMYSGGGYVAELRTSRASMTDKIRQLRRQKWIDKFTRVVFIEFTVYNPNVNLFGISTLVAEILNSGGIFTSYRFEPVKLLSYFTGTMLFQIICEVVYMFFIIFFVIKEGRNLQKQRRDYFKQFWNWVELCIIGFSIAGTVVYFYRLFLTNKLVTRFKKSHGNEYMKFQYVGRWNELLMCMVAWLVFLASLKFLKLLRFNKKIGMMAATLRYGSVHMCAFGFMFSIMFLAFAQFFYLIYHIEMQSFSTVVRSAETCMQMMLGRFNFYAMKTAQPLLGPLFFFIYTVVVAYILINMFLTILNESFSIVRADLAKQSNEYEMVEFIIRRFKIWTGLGYRSIAKTFHETGRRGIRPLFPVEVEEFPHKVDRLLNCISKVYFDQDRFENIFDSSKADNKHVMKKLMNNPGRSAEAEVEAAMSHLNKEDAVADVDC